MLLGIFQLVHKLQLIESAASELYSDAQSEHDGHGGEHYGDEQHDADDAVGSELAVFATFRDGADVEPEHDGHSGEHYGDEQHDADDALGTFASDQSGHGHDQRVTS